MTISRMLAAALAFAAFAVPAAALAQPADMHASTAIAAAQAQQKQDLRSADAADAAIHPRAFGQTRPVPQQAPTWPVDPQPITSAPAAQPVTTGGDGIDWGTIAIGVGLTLVAVGGFALVADRRRRGGTPRLGASV
jgi:hypothetical protein